VPAPLTRHREAKRFELELAKDLDARRVFLSGAGDEKADVRRKAGFTQRDGAVVRSTALTFRAEAKTTQYDSYAFKAVDWFDVARAADGAGEIPVFAIRFLKLNEGLAIARQSFMYELGIFAPEHSLTFPVEKSKRLRPVHRDSCEALRVLRPKHPGGASRPDVLVLTSYDNFIQRVRAHADFARAT
jgi:hypothetical protein